MGKANRTIISSHSHVHFNGPSHLARSSGLYQPATHNRTYKSNWLARLACVCLCERTRALFTMHWLPIDIHFVVIWYFTQCTAILYYAGKSTFSQIAFFHFYSSKQLQKKTKKKRTNCWLKPFTHDDRLSALDGLDIKRSVGRSVFGSFVRVRARNLIDDAAVVRSFASIPQNHGTVLSSVSMN